LLTTFLLLLVFLYGHVFDLMENTRVAGIDIGHHLYLASFWVVLFVVGLWAIIKIIKFPQNWTRPLNIIGLLLLVYPMIQIATYQVNSTMVARRANLSASNSLAGQLHPPAGETLPDIFYIILDTYTRGDALLAEFNYDNSVFLDGLEQRGFYIGNCSQSNYGYTEASLTSSLNMQYLASLDAHFTPPNQSIDDLTPFLQDSSTIQTLHSLGYKLVAFDSGYSPTDLRNVDVFLSPQSSSPESQLISGLNPFEAMLLRTTLGRLFLDIHVLPRGLEGTLFNSAYLTHRQRILYEFSELAATPSIPGPKFVFVHILAPHNPFVFGPNGEVLTRTTPFTLNVDVDALTLPAYIKGYDGQVNYLNQRTLQAIDAILANSPTPPIIIIQGDHGSPRTPGWNMTILNAYYFPDERRRSLLYPSISPVNTFRVVFNAYFGGKFVLLDDKACNWTGDGPYECPVLIDPNPKCVPATP
jgi:hypothetical protein